MFIGKLKRLCKDWLRKLADTNSLFWDIFHEFDRGNESHWRFDEDMWMVLAMVTLLILSFVVVIWVT